MSRNPNNYSIADYTFTANEVKRIDFEGDDIFVRSSAAEITVKIDSPSNNPIPMNDGERLETNGFQTLVVSSESAQTVSLLIGPKGLRIDGISVSGEVSIDHQDVLKTTADVSLAASATTLIKAKNDARNSIVITNLASNTKTIRIGDSDAGATRGTPLTPGASIALDTVSAVYGYAPAGTAESVAVLEL